MLSSSVDRRPDVVDGDAGEDAGEAVGRRLSPVLEREYGREHKNGHRQEDRRHDRVSRHAERSCHPRSAPSKDVDGGDKQRREQRLSDCGVLVHVLEVEQEQNHNRTGALCDHGVCRYAAYRADASGYCGKQAVFRHGVVDSRAGDDKSADRSQERQADRDGEDARSPCPEEIRDCHLRDHFGVLETHFVKRHGISKRQVKPQIQDNDKCSA